MKYMTSLQDTVINVMSFSWPMIAICLVIITSLRLTYLLKNKKSFILYKEVMTLFFIIYILCLFQVVTYQDVTDGVMKSNFIPFHEMMRYQIFSRLFLKNVLGNILLFFPFGFFANYYTKNKNWFVALFLTLLSSFTIEITQLAIGRVFDIDDIILNVAGGMLGFIFYYALVKLWNVLPKLIKKRWFLDLVSILSVVIMLIIIYMVVLR